MTDKLKELFDEVCVVNRPSILVYGFPYVDPSRASEYYGSHREYISKYISGYDKYVKHLSTSLSRNVSENMLSV